MFKYIIFEQHNLSIALLNSRLLHQQVYDVATGRVLLQLSEESKSNNYQWNRATFNPSDDLILNDGLLWDVNSGKCIHKFDKFNPNVSGVFHPNGLEIIINSEVVSFA